MPLQSNSIHSYQTTNGIKRVVQQELLKEKPAAYIVFSNAQPSFVDSAADNHELIGSKGVRVTYDQASHRMIIKLPSGPHETAERNFSGFIEFDRHLMGISGELKPIGAKGVAEGQVYKEPDSCWQPGGPRLFGIYGQMPSFGSNSQGYVGAVILIFINRRLGQLIFDKWTPTSVSSGQGSIRIRATCSKVVDMRRRANNQVIITGDPLTISFQEMTLREPQSNLDGDFVVDRERLLQIANFTCEEKLLKEWERQAEDEMVQAEEGVE